MKPIKKIQLSTLFDNQISGRSAVDSIFSSLEGVHHFILDFSSIRFISRSAAHQLISTMDLLQKNRVTVELLSLDPEVERMLSRVRKSIEKPTKLATYVEFLSFSSEKEMEKFMMSI
ncbi:STAS domain-containing protein [Algoriphagus namhaensis]